MIAILSLLPSKFLSSSAISFASLVGLPSNKTQNLILERSDFLKIITFSGKGGYPCAFTYNWDIIFFAALILSKQPYLFLMVGMNDLILQASPWTQGVHHDLAAATACSSWGPLLFPHKSAPLGDEDPPALQSPEPKG